MADVAADSVADAAADVVAADVAADAVAADAEEDVAAADAEEEDVRQAIENSSQVRLDQRACFAEYALCASEHFTIELL